LAEVREVNPALGAQHGTLAQLQRAEQAIAESQKTVRNPQSRASFWSIWCSVKKVSNGCFQGLDPGEIDLQDFPFRLKKSRK
jgi:hypothetical protein